MCAQSLCPGFVRTEPRSVPIFSPLRFRMVSCMSAQDVVAGSLRDLAADHRSRFPAPSIASYAIAAKLVPSSTWQAEDRPAKVSSRIYTKEIRDDTATALQSH